MLDNKLLVDKLVSLTDSDRIRWRKKSFIEYRTVIDSSSIVLRMVVHPKKWFKPQSPTEYTLTVNKLSIKKVVHLTQRDFGRISAAIELQLDRATDDLILDILDK